MKSSRLFAASALVACAAVGLSGCTTISTLYNAYGPRPVEPTPTYSFAPTGLVQLKMGECVDKAALEDDKRTTEPVVSCAEDHDLQVYYQFELEGKEYPSIESISNLATTACNAEFVKFVGVDFGISQLNYVFYYPTETSWAAGDRGVDCAIFDPFGKTQGSLRNAKR